MPRSTARGLVLAILAIAAAVGLRLATEPVLGGRAPFILLFPAVLFTAWYAGRAPALIATLLAALSTLLVFPARDAVMVETPTSYWFGILLFVLVSVTMIEIVMATRRAESAQQRATGALREVESRFQALMTYAPLAVFAKDREGRYLLVNASFCTLAGKREADIVGRTDRDLFGAATAERFVRADAAVLATGEPVSFEESFTYAGQDYTFLTVKFPMRDPAGEAYAVCGIANDITARKQAEAALHDADRRKDEFLAVLAHELRNPLAPIRLGLEALRGGDGASQARALEIMGRQLAHLVRLIDDLLDVSRITRGKLELRRTNVALADIVRAALETSRPVIDAAGHTLTVELPDDPIVVHADLTRLAQVLANLLTNAAKYTPRGGRITLTVERGEGDVVLRVADTGIGIAAADLAHVFDMFAQITAVAERTQGGLGIGLALARQLVELHGGTIEATSAGADRGSTFTVRLPIAELPVELPRAAEPVLAAVPGTRVLIADDNVDASELLAELLALAGYEVKTAADGAQALALVDSFAPDVAVLDIGMPNLDGHEVARRLRARPEHATTMLIAMTGWGQVDDVRRSREAGFDHHLTKPVQPSELMKLLARARRAA